MGRTYFVHLQKKILYQIGKHDDSQRRGTTLNVTFYPLFTVFLFDFNIHKMLHKRKNQIKTF